MSDDQMRLIDPPEVCEYDLPDANYREHTALRLKIKEPERYAAVVKALKDGMPMSGVAAAYSLSRNTVAAVVRLEFGAVEQWREHCGSIVRSAAVACVERLSEIAHTSTKVAEVAMAGKLMIDAAQTMSGQPTEIIRHEHTITLAPDLREADLAALRDAARMGLATGKSLTMPTRATTDPSPVIEAETLYGADEAQS